MDVTDCLYHLLQGLKNGDHDQVEASAVNLSSWARGRGEVPSKDELAGVCASFIAQPQLDIPPVPKTRTAPTVHRESWPYRPIVKPPGTLPYR